MVSPDNITVGNVESVPGGNSILLGRKKTKVNSFVSSPSVCVPFFMLWRKTNAGKTTGVISANDPISGVYVSGNISKIFNSIIFLVSVNVVNKVRLNSVINNPSAPMGKINLVKYFGVKIAASVLGSKRFFSAEFSSPFCVRAFASFKEINSSWLVSKFPSFVIVREQAPEKFRVVKSMSHNLSFLYGIRYRLRVTEYVGGVKINA